MARSIAAGVFALDEPVGVRSYASVVGKKEGEGPLGSLFDEIIEDARFGKDAWEQAESRFQLEAVSLAIRKAGLVKEDVEAIFAGDLVNQCICSTYGLRELGIPYFGIYGACSTMAEGLLLASLLADSGAAKTAAAVASSHFATAERQFRYPLAYGGQRTPTSQWTCTAAGAVVLSAGEAPVAVAGGCIGKIADMGISDVNNMGAAMAPAAAETLLRYFSATGTSPGDFGFIATGDLGTVGSSLLADILMKQGVDISGKHEDCGSSIFDLKAQEAGCGGSGCGCGASVLCAKYLPALEAGELRDGLFIATGALMSPTSLQQGETIPAIAHLVHFVRR